MRKKIITTVIFSLLVGFILGFWLSGVMARKRIHKLRKMHEPRYFKQELFETINPNPKQADLLDSLLDDHLYKARMSRLKARNDMRLQYDSLFKSMENVLDEQQKEKLRKQKRKLRMIQKRPPPPPPPH